MKNAVADANFPKTADQRVYHLGIRPGEVANRIITVGPPSRARRIAANLDPLPKIFELSSERGFVTITGRFNGVPVSILSIGMGSPNMDFFVREVRECIAGDLLIVRVGSCGGLVDVPVGSITVPKACVAISRNLDFPFGGDEHEIRSSEPPYKISQPVGADKDLHAAVLSAVLLSKPLDHTVVLDNAVNASADSFYSSQGRQTSFADHNSSLIAHLLETTPELKTLEMETHHLFYLAAMWGRRPRRSADEADPAPITAGPVDPTPSVVAPAQAASIVRLADPSTIVRAAAVQMLFASRVSQVFITPEKVVETEDWTGLAVLRALSEFTVEATSLHPEEESVWQL